MGKTFLGTKGLLTHLANYHPRIWASLENAPSFYKVSSHHYSHLENHHCSHLADSWRSVKNAQDRKEHPHNHTK